MKITVMKANFMYLRKITLNRTFINKVGISMATVDLYVESV